MGEVVQLTSGRSRQGSKIPQPRDCDDCGELIETARIQVRPDAKRCVGCQTLFERRRIRMLQGAGDKDTVILRGR